MIKTPGVVQIGTHKSYIAVKKPSYVDWNPIINVYSDFSTDYNEENFKLPATSDVWISNLGNDTIGIGTELNPFKTFSKAVSYCNTLPDTAINIFIKSGEYLRIDTWRTSPDKDINVIAVGGSVVLSTRYEPLSWSLHSGNTYKATRSAVGLIVDESNLDQYGVAKKLDLTASIELCVATENTYFTDGTTLYVHRKNNLNIDSGLKVISNLSGVTLKANRKYFVKGIIFEGGSAGFNTQDSDFIATDTCIFRYSMDSGYKVYGSKQSIAYNCKAYGNTEDGFNYHVGLSGLVNPVAVEINCKGFSNGLTGNNDNGSTIHDNCRILRVGCDYYGNYGPNMVDVNNSISWNLKCSSYGSLGESTSNSSYYATENTIMILDSCFGDSGYVVANGNSMIAYKNSNLIGSIIGNVVNGYE